jgi:hypothetical protein
MTVKDLLDKLEGFPEDLEICFYTKTSGEFSDLYVYFDETIAEEGWEDVLLILEGKL